VALDCSQSSCMYPVNLHQQFVKGSPRCYSTILQTLCSFLGGPYLKLQAWPSEKAGAVCWQFQDVL
jgi:hypothetical protein